jgi:transposase InsO family protein
MGKERFEQWLYDIAYTTVKHFHGDNGIFASEQYCLECVEKGQTQSFSGVGAQHQNAKAERAIQTVMYMARTFVVHTSLHWMEHGVDGISL